MSGFVHLHLHTEYSLLDGDARISRIADKALSDGQTAVAITDHGVMYGAVEFYDQLKAKGLKPIIGCEVYVAERSRLLKEGKQDTSGNHMILLCKNETGYKNLCYLVSMSFIDGFYTKPRIDMDLLKGHADGLIALSGCLAGKIPRLILAGGMPEAEAYAREMRAIFGDDFYLEVQNHLTDEERKVAFGIKLISEKTGIPMVATNDVHYIDRNDADTQATMICIQTNNIITDGRPLGFEGNEFYFKTEKEMRELFAGFRGAVDNTVLIAEKCNFDFEFDKLHLPDFKPENGEDHKSALRTLTYNGYERLRSLGRFDLSSHTENEYKERIEYELSVIDKMGFNAYYLIVSDFVGYAKKNDIPVGPGRGSGAGSLVAFCVGITDVDPIAFDLLFERFLNPERVSMPDFDIDFCYNRREEVIDYVKRKYGNDKVAQIVTFGTLAARAAVRDVGRALGMPYGKVDAIAKLIPREMNVTIDSALKSKELKEIYDTDPDVRKLINTAKSLEGVPRHASTHAAGVVITEKPTYEYVPLSYSGTGVVTQFDMNTAARLGLVKFDFLGLRYITVIHDAELEIRKTEKDFDISKIPLDDKDTFRLLCDAKTDGVFQLESAGMKQVLSKLCPSTLEDVIAVIALYRPGPMDQIDTFIARKHGKEQIKYATPALEKLLNVTYGCIVYQEQVMQICRELAGYSYARADLVRRAMSKKKTEVMKAERENFLEGCRDRGISDTIANDIFDEMVGFAKYAFNKSHATAYGIISYRTAYLKAHYPAQYYAALMTSVLSSTQKLREYIADAQKMGVSVLPPDINKSSYDFSVYDGHIRFGLLAIKNVGSNFARSVINERRAGSFTAFDEFVRRLSESELNKRTLDSLIKCGVFDSLGVSRSSLLSCYEQILESEQAKKRNNISGQMDLFSMSVSDVGQATGYEYPVIEEFTQKELLIMEKESSGMYFSGHLLDDFSNQISDLSPDRISEIVSDIEEGENAASRYKDGAHVKIGGIITSKKTKVLKNGDVMAYTLIDDKYGEIEVVIFARQYSRLSHILTEDNAVLIEGRISYEEGESISILLSDARELLNNTEYKGAPKPSATTQRLFIKLSDLSDKALAPIYRLSSLNPGKVQIVLFNERDRKYVNLKNVTIDPCEKVLTRLRSLFGENCVVLK